MEISLLTPACFVLRKGTYRTQHSDEDGASIPWQRNIPQILFTLSCRYIIASEFHKHDNSFPIGHFVLLSLLFFRVSFFSSEGAGR